MCRPTACLYVHKSLNNDMCCLSDVHSVAESSGSRSVPECSESQTSVVADANARSKSQNKDLLTTKARPKKRRKVMVR